MNSVTTTGLPIWRSGLLVVSAVIVAACTTQLAVSPGASRSAGSASDAASPTDASSTGSSTDAQLVPSSAPSRDAGFVSPGASQGAASSGGGSGGPAPGTPFVCPIEPTPALGTICAPASDLLFVRAAAGTLTAPEIAAGTRGWMVRGSTPCDASPATVGCAAPNSPQGEVIIEFRDSAPVAHVLVFRRADGSLGATRLG